MKVLLVGNHTCGNRGDAAILRGLVSELRAQEPSIDIDIISRFPVSSSYLLGEKVHSDTLDAFHRNHQGIKGRVFKIALPWLLRMTCAGLPLFILPNHFVKHIKNLQKYDAIIQVGGSFFVDLYGETQFEHALSALTAGKPIYLLGHSVGPFERKRFKSLAKMVFDNVSLLSLRERVSLAHVKGLSCENSVISQGADTAWLVPNLTIPLKNHWYKKLQEKKTIAITVRNLAPFDRRLGISQDSYEHAMSMMIKALIQKDYRVVLFSTCTGIDSYNRDDRMVALNIAEKIDNSTECIVIMDELNDIELGQCLSECILTIGTRLHSAIISMNFNTPAIALNYEHKSKGIMAQLGVPECSSDLTELVDGSLTNKVFDLLEKIEVRAFDISSPVENERQRAKTMISQFLQNFEQS